MEDAVALKEYVLTLWARRAMIAVVTLAAVVAAGVISYFVLPATYEASAVLILYGPRFRMSVPTNEARMESFPQTALTDQTIAPLVYNQVVAARVANRLSNSRGISPENLLEMVRITPVRGTDLVKVSARHVSAQTATDVVQAWARTIVDYTGLIWTQEVRQSLTFVEREVATAAATLVTAERALREFDAVSKLPLLEQRNQEMVRRIALYEVRLTELERGGAPLEGQVALQPQAGGYTMSVSALRDPLQVRRVLDTLRTRLASSQQEAARERQRQTSLTRQAAVSRSTYALLVNKREELRVLLAVNRSAAEVAVPPTVPRTPVAPNKVLNMAVAAMLGLLGGTLLAMVVGQSRAPAAAPSPTAVGQESVPAHRA